MAKITMVKIYPIIESLLLCLPFIIFNFLVENEVKTFMSLIRPDGHTSILEQVLLFGSLVCVFLGGLVSLSAFRGNKMVGIFGAILIVFSLWYLYQFGIEVYRQM